MPDTMAVEDLRSGNDLRGRRLKTEGGDGKIEG